MTFEYIDADRILRLARDLVGDVGTCVRFVDDFVRAWNERLTRVYRAVGDGSLDEGLAALLSIATSSRMLGADHLGAVAQDLHADALAVRAISAPGAERLARVGAASCDELLRLTAPWRVAA